MDKSVNEKIFKAAHDAEGILNREVGEFSKTDRSNEHQEFYLLKLQCGLIHFELCSDMVAVLRTVPASFSRKVVLKNIVHKIYEYTRTLSNHHMSRIVFLARKRGLNTLASELPHRFRNFKKSLRSIDLYKDLRNTASGHYDPDISNQINAIIPIDENEVFKIIKNFISIDMDILKILRNIGVRVDSAVTRPEH